MRYSRFLLLLKQQHLCSPPLLSDPGCDFYSGTQKCGVQGVPFLFSAILNSSERLLLRVLGRGWLCPVTAPASGHPCLGSDRAGWTQTGGSAGIKPMEPDPQGSRDSAGSGGSLVLRGHPQDPPAKGPCHSPYKHLLRACSGPGPMLGRREGDSARTSAPTPSCSGLRQRAPRTARSRDFGLLLARRGRMGDARLGPGARPRAPPRAAPGPQCAFQEPLPRLESPAVGPRRWRLLSSR